MASSADPTDSARRIARRAVLLTAPLVLVGVGAPRLVRMLKPAPRPAAEELVVAGGLPAADPAPTPRPPESPTPEQIERARDSQLDLGKAQRGWKSVTVIAPRETRAAGDAQETFPFDGFALSVESDPEGAAVTVGGRLLGDTPVMSSLPCTPGAELQVRIEKDGLPPRELPVKCRKDTLVKLKVRLGAPPAPAAAPAGAPASAPPSSR